MNTSAQGRTRRRVVTLVARDVISDGRAMRAASALAERYDVHVLCSLRRQEAHRFERNESGVPVVAMDYPPVRALADRYDYLELYRWDDSADELNWDCERHRLLALYRRLEGK